MPCIEFDLDISRETLLLYYRGEVRNVVTPSLDGRTVSFPVHLLRDFVNHSGVRGRFRLYYDQSGRFTGIERS